MRYLAVILLPLVGIYFGTANAEIINGSVYGSRKNLDTEVVVTDIAKLLVNSIYAPDYVYLDNHGTVKVKNIYVPERGFFYLENSGHFSGNFVVGDSYYIYQVLRDTDDISVVGYNVDFSVLVRDSAALSWTDVLNVANGADKIILDNATLVLDTDRLNSVPIEINGENLLIVDDISDFYGAPLLANVSGNGRVRLQSHVINPLFAGVSYFENDSLYIRRERITDYATILGNDTGVYLNNLRMKNPNDPLLGALDSAGDMNALRETMARSVRLNPIRLMTPIIQITDFDKLNFNVDNWGINSGVGAIVNKNMEYYGANIAFSGVAENIKFGLSLDMGQMEYSDDINYFVGDIYGGRFVADYNWRDANRLRLMLGGKIVNFSSGEVFMGHNNVVKDPRGVIVYGVTEYALDFGPFSPFVGFDFDYVSVTNDNENNVVGRGGVDMRYTHEMLGLRYDYAVRIGANTDGTIFAKLRAGVLSIMDNAGGDISIATIRRDDITSYKFGFAARVLF
ncbi:MAG: hypothetical protein IJX89_03890 [Alphaproteobacteria bacterium]|nr:hypothetical protein [Alphaproteobacteria bacterium]